MVASEGLTVTLEEFPERALVRIRLCSALVEGLDDPHARVYAAAHLAASIAMKKRGSERFAIYVGDGKYGSAFLGIEGIGSKVPRAAAAEFVRMMFLARTVVDRLHKCEVPE